MKIIKTKIKDLKIIKFNKISDQRGIFYRNYCAKEFLKITKKKIVQSNFSFNKKKYTLRGFHYQKYPSKEGKFITCLNGKIYNVTIDLRKNSNTYLKNFCIIVDSNKYKSLYIPPGCANAFLTMENNTTIHYLMTDYYKPKSYECFNYRSKEIKVQWPAKPKVISYKDKNSKNLNLDE